MIERWKPMECISIPIDNYRATFYFGQLRDYDAATIYLEGDSHKIRIETSNYYFRVFDRCTHNGRLLLTQINSNKYACNDFQEVIYEVENSSHLLDLEANSVALLYKDTQKHFMLIASNFIIEFINIYGEPIIDMEEGCFERGKPWNIGKI